VNPRNARATRRVDAERVLTRHAKRGAFRLIILRVPVFTAKPPTPVSPASRHARAGGGRRRLHNHIHAADLASIAAAALKRLRKRARPQVRIYHASDDSEIKWAIIRSDRRCLQVAAPAAPAARGHRGRGTTALLSFMRESRRLDNSRLKRELPIRWFARTVRAGIAAAAALARIP